MVDNPFARIFSGEEPPRFARETGIGAVLDRYGSNPLPTRQEFEAAERIQTRNAAAEAAQRKALAEARAIQLVAEIRAKNPALPPQAVMSTVLNNPQFQDIILSPTSGVPDAEDITELIQKVAVATTVEPNRLGELLRGFAPGVPVPTEGPGRFAAPELVGESRTPGPLSQALGLNEQQSRAMQEAAKLDPSATAAETRAAITKRTLSPEAPAPRIDGLLPQQQELINESWKEGKPHSTMQLAADFLEKNQQSVALLNDAHRSANIVSSAIDQTVSILQEEGNLAAGRGAPLRFLPGTAAKQVEGLLNTIKSNVAFSTLKDIKKTGAGLGALSDAELTLLQSNIADLDISQDPRVLMANLQQVRGIFSRIAETSKADLIRYGVSPVDHAVAAKQALEPTATRPRLRFDMRTGRYVPQ